MMQSAEERIGIFGGSFDPVHLGHLEIASQALEQLELNRVLFVPASVSPLKSSRPSTSTKDRLAMLNLAIESNPNFELYKYEIERGGISYSIDTALSLKASYPNARLFWILGGDQARQLDQWRQIEELAKIVDFVCLDRDETTELPENTRSFVTLHPLALSPIDISSTEIRKRLRTGKQSNYFLPEPVFHYIKSRNLYSDQAITK